MLPWLGPRINVLPDFEVAPPVTQDILESVCGRVHNRASTYILVMHSYFSSAAFVCCLSIARSLTGPETHQLAMFTAPRVVKLSHPGASPTGFMQLVPFISPHSPSFPRLASNEHQRNHCRALVATRCGRPGAAIFSRCYFD